MATTETKLIWRKPDVEALLKRMEYGDGAHIHGMDIIAFCKDWLALHALVVSDPRPAPAAAKEIM